MYTIVAIEQISTMGKVLQQRCDDNRTGTIERCYEGRKEDCSPVSEDSRSAGEGFTKEGFPTTNPSPAAVSPSVRSERGAPRAGTGAGNPGSAG